MALPTMKSEKNYNLEDQIILVYGRPKIGKSTFCSNLDKALFLATEPGLNHLEVFKMNINSWENFCYACAEIQEGKHDFTTIVIDTVDNMVMYCSQWVCKQYGVDYPGDLDFGKGWNAVTKELKRTLSSLSNLPYGLIMIGHSKVEEVETKTKKYNRVELNLSGKNSDVIKDMSDIILFMDSYMKNDEEMGIIRTKSSQYWLAGDRSKLLPEEIEYPLSDPTVAYSKVAGCFKKGGGK